MSWKLIVVFGIVAVCVTTFATSWCCFRTPEPFRYQYRVLETSDYARLVEIDTETRTVRSVFPPLR